MMKSLDILFVTQDDLAKAGCFNISKIIDVVEDAFLRRSQNRVIFPDKVSAVFDELTQNRINCLPAGSFEESVYGMKWVSVFPGNPHQYGVQNVSAVILLSDLKYGFPKAFMDGTMCSDLRTAATSAVAANYLAKTTAETIGFIGAGEQAKSHLLTLKKVRPTINKCKVSSRTSETEQHFIQQMSVYFPDVEFIPCHGNFRLATKDADIIVTAISGQEKILQADWITPGSLYCHVGGLEDDYSVPLIADKIICDDWGVVKHRTQTISRMYKEGLLKDSDIYCNLHELVDGSKIGRETNEEFIYFNTVGMSFVDVLLANDFYKQVVNSGLGKRMVFQQDEVFSISPSLIKL